MPETRLPWCIYRGSERPRVLCLLKIYPPDTDNDLTHEIRIPFQLSAGPIILDIRKVLSLLVVGYIEVDSTVYCTWLFTKRYSAYMLVRSGLGFGGGVVPEAGSQQRQRQLLSPTKTRPRPSSQASISDKSQSVGK
jgi:hypothetical protein